MRLLLEIRTSEGMAWRGAAAGGQALDGVMAGMVSTCGAAVRSFVLQADRAGGRTQGGVVWHGSAAQSPALDRMMDGTVFCAASLFVRRWME